MREILFIAFLGLVISACKKEECDDVVPVVDIKEIVVSGGKTIMTLKVYDCDGDIGLNEGDTMGPLKYNAFIDIRPFSNGAWSTTTFDYINFTVEEILDTQGRVIAYDTIRDTTNFYYRVPVVNTNSRTLIYDAEVDFDLGVTDFGFDTFRFEVFVRDKDLHNSAVVQSETRFSN
jgi:hypothetical protein